jgi:hypothetical protein
MTRTINTRNANIGTHTMSGQNYTMAGNTIQRFGNLTIIKGDHVQFRANNFQVASGATDAPQPVQPRRAPPNMIAKISGEFGSKTITLPTAYDNNYMIQVAFTITGEYELESLNSVNPTTLSKDAIQAHVNKTLGDFFYGMEVTHASDQGLDQGIIPNFIIGNQYGSYTLTAGTTLVWPSAKQYIFIIKYSVSISKEKKLVDQWQLTLTATLEATVTITKRNTFDDLKITANNVIQQTQTILQEHENSPYVGPIIRSLRTYARPIINSMYQKAGALDSMTIIDLEFI